MNIVFFYVAASSAVVGAAIQYMFDHAIMDRARQHRDAEIKEAKDEIMRLRAQVSLHIGRNS